MADSPPLAESSRKWPEEITPVMMTAAVNALADYLGLFKGTARFAVEVAFDAALEAATAECRGGDDAPSRKMLSVSRDADVRLFPGVDTNKTFIVRALAAHAAIATPITMLTLGKTAEAYAAFIAGFAADASDSDPTPTAASHPPASTSDENAQTPAQSSEGGR